MEKNTPVKYAICMVLIILAFLVHKTAGYLLFLAFLIYILYSQRSIFYQVLATRAYKKGDMDRASGWLERLAVPLKADLRLKFVWIFAS